MKICVIGLGEVGLPTALYLQSKGFDVYGVDIDEQRLSTAHVQGLGDSLTRPRSDLKNVPQCFVYIVIVNTDEVDVKNVFDVCRQIKEHTRGAIVSIESTVYPGTCRKLWLEVFDSEGTLLHVPQRYWSADPEGRGVRRFRLLTAMTRAGLGLGTELYRKLFDIPIYPVLPIEIAELAKVSENAYRGVQIAFAQELKRITDTLELDFNMVREAIMTASNTHNLPEARDGIGGHCIPMAMRWFNHLVDAELIKGAIESNEHYKRRVSIK